MRRLLSILVLLITLTALGACGTRGALYLPPPQAKASTPPVLENKNTPTPTFPANPNTTKEPD
jgi:predicted small lipoprotein YifL